jgi:4-phospho-D-threonate 3-dehydrogenase / 4-phospho-D-erythronate 3-dehydrogenase
MKPRIAITMGDMNGIGPEVALKAAVSPAVRRVCEPLLVGRPEVFARYARLLHPVPRLITGPPEGKPGRGTRPEIRVFEVPGATAVPRPGRNTREAGEAASKAIAAAAKMALVGDVQAIVTAPVSKKALHMAGITYPGQTELLKDLTDSASVAMMLVSPTMRVGLATIHLPLAQVSGALTRATLYARITTIHTALRKDWGIARPILAVLGLNPHAGEGGDIGKEEERVIIPVLTRLRAEGIRVEGPFPADAFFVRMERGRYDAVVAMFHDQGLIPLKMTARGRGVNYTAGLRIVRTSPDHGTAFPIAGTGTADPRSMVEAIRIAAVLARARAKDRS